MEKTILGENSSQSPVMIGNAQAGLQKFLPDDQNIIVVSDANVHRIYKDLINRYEHIIIGQGESNKTLVTVESIYRGLLEKGADRSTFILGVGGGIVTDSTGFAASTYMRGVRFGFIPTTLLGQVDASIGGKNGVNLDGYKNIVGTFNQPEFVICDPEMTTTLSDREFRSGLAEVIKTAIIGDRALFELIESHDVKELRGNMELLAEVIERAVRVKMDIVGQDECENGCRRILNLGHTLGHAFEKGVQNIMHGEAVGIGMAIMSRVAESRGLLPHDDCERILNVISKVGLPTKSPIEISKLLKHIKYDKKREGNYLHIIFPHAIGRCAIETLPFEESQRMFSSVEASRTVEENAAAS